MNSAKWGLGLRVHLGYKEINSEFFRLEFLGCYIKIIVLSIEEENARWINEMHQDEVQKVKDFIPISG